MIFSCLSLSQKRWRAWFAWGAIVALVARGIIPVGYMPDFSGALDHSFITICSGMDMTSMPLDGAQHRDNGAADKNSSGRKFQDHAPCPFSVNAVFAFTGAGPVDDGPLALFIIAIALAGFVFGQRRYFGNVAPRAPPLFS